MLKLRTERAAIAMSLLAASGLLAGGLVIVTTSDDRLLHPAGGVKPPTVQTTRAATTTTQAPPLPAAAPPEALVELWQHTPGGCLSVRYQGREIYEQNADEAVVPASVTKILTGYAALELLGADTRLSTVVRGPVPDAGIVRGDIALVGGGDPVLGSNAWATARSVPLHTSLDTLADRIVERGVTTVEGGVVGVEDRYDSLRIVPSWPRRLVADGESGPLSALLVNDGFQVWGHPGVPFSSPPQGAAEALTELLEVKGVTVTGTPTTGAAPSAEVSELARVESPPVSELVAAMLRHSDNETAELLVKEIGFRQRNSGTTAAGSEAITAVLAAQGWPVDASVVADGSGLSDAARVTCRLLTTVLAEAEPIVESLSVAGEIGTLENRFGDAGVHGRLRAKTGSLNGIAALAGSLPGRAGPVTFSYVVNGLPAGATGRPLQDALAEAIAEVSLSPPPSG